MIKKINARFLLKNFFEKKYIYTKKTYAKYKK